MAEKTEKPTAKKRADSEKKGRSLKVADVVTMALLVVGVGAIPYIFRLSELEKIVGSITLSKDAPAPMAYVNALAWIFVKDMAAFLVLCSVAGALPSLLHSRFTLAFEAIKFNFESLNPINGLKRIFNIRVIKEFVKTILYLFVTIVATTMLIWLHCDELFGSFNLGMRGLLFVASKLIKELALLLLAFYLPILVLDAVAEYFLYIKGIKMEKYEVKQEMKQSHGNPAVKSRQKSLAREGLNEKTKENIEKSNVLIANPTHIAIGIYLDPKVTPYPMVSVREVNERARAAIAHAEECGVPVLRDIALARNIFKRSKCYQFVAVEDIEGVIRILTWLKQVELAGAPPKPGAASDED
jgi:type III secretion protein U